MKQLLNALWMVILISVACNKKTSTSARLVVVNGTHSLTSLSATWNGNNITPTPLAPSQYSGNTSSIYTEVAAGTNNIVLQNGTAILFDKNIYARPVDAYTLLAYDTGKLANSTRFLYLTDNIQPQETDTMHVRFLYLLPDTVPVDVILLKPLKNDTIFNNVSFVGKDANERTIEVFTEKKAADVTGIKINKTGTNISLITTGSFSFQKKSFYTITYSGLTGGTANAAPQLKILKH
jgi:hypothetical protein